MIDKTPLEAVLNQCDFTDYRWINPAKIVTGHWVRFKCMFGCEQFGNATCPPNVPSIDECRAFFEEYSAAVLLHFPISASKEKYPIDWSREIQKRLLECEKKLFLMNFPKVFLLNLNCCIFCKECKKDRIQCVHKQDARPAPEAFGVDVYATARKAGYDLRVIPDTPGEMNRFAILLVE